MFHRIASLLLLALFSLQASANYQTTYMQYLKDIQEIVTEGLAIPNYPNAEICNEAALEYEVTGSMLAYDHLNYVDSAFLQYEMCLALGAEKWIEQYTHVVKGRYCGYYCDEEVMGGNPDRSEDEI